MKEIIDSVEIWRQCKEKIAIATVVSTWGSAPRPVGGKMAMTLNGGIAGSVSGGCVEGAVIAESEKVIKSLKPALVTYGVSDDEAWQVGLACGGTIAVSIEPFVAWRGIYSVVRKKIEAKEPFVVVSMLKGSSTHQNQKLLIHADNTTSGDLALGDQQATILAAVEKQRAKETSATFDLDENTSVFFDVYPSNPKLIIIGAVHIAEQLIQQAILFGFETVLIDPRAAFANQERFPPSTEVIQSWPDQALPKFDLDKTTYVVVLTHDPKIDDPAIIISLQSNARYIGALGSRKTNRKRVDRLRSAGLSDEAISRLHAPIGLPLGGKSPAEIAISIMAEIIQAKNNPPK